MLGLPNIRPRVPGLSGFFSGKVEDSLRLRLLGLATFWLVALSVAWVGGSPWSWLGGGVAATCGHAFSWYRRHRRVGPWPLLMALMMVGLALVMRSEVLAALDGNWLPLAHFLLLVQAIASFEIRTRGGLYAGLGLSGIVLFFASQQAFELSFGAFLVGYAALLMAFLATAFLEDEAGAARNRPASPKMPMVGFWCGTVIAVLVLAVAAFLLLPRGESNAVGYQEVAALPITGNPEGSGTSTQVEAGPQITPQAGSPSSGEGGPLANEPSSDGPKIASGSQPQPGETLDGGSNEAASRDALPVGPAGGAPADDVVMHVRSPVASYWRGNVFDTFDGTSWHAKLGPDPVGAAQRTTGSPLRYTQNYFVHRGDPGATFMGYHGVKVLASEDTAYQKSLGKGFSYKVVSSRPQLLPEKLRQDRPGRARREYYTLPSSLAWLPGLADQITEGANTGFDRAVRIVDFLRQNTTYDADAPDQLKPAARLDDFLLEGEPGTSMDFATASVMLARAAGPPGCRRGWR